MSAIASAATLPQSFSPLSRLKTELASEVSAGTISSADQSALSSALDSIDSTMRASRPTDGSGPPSPDEMQAKIDSLIDAQVSSGSLTSDQAEDLKNVFANTFKNGPEGAGGPPPGAGPDDSSSTSSTSSSDSDLAKLLTEFLQSLKDSKSSSTGYGSTGSSLSSQLQSLVLDYSA